MEYEGQDKPQVPPEDEGNKEGLGKQKGQKKMGWPRQRLTGTVTSSIQPQNRELSKIPIDL